MRFVLLLLIFLNLFHSSQAQRGRVMPPKNPTLKVHETSPFPIQAHCFTYKDTIQIDSILAVKEVEMNFDKDGNRVQMIITQYNYNEAAAERVKEYGLLLSLEEELEYVAGVYEIHKDRILVAFEENDFMFMETLTVKPKEKNDPDEYLIDSKKRIFSARKCSGSTPN